MPQSPLEDLGPMVKIGSTFMKDETPELYKTLTEPLQILKTWLLWHFFQSYMLFLVIIEKKIEIKLSCMMPAGVCIQIYFSFRDQSRQNSLLVCFNSISHSCTLLYVGKSFPFEVAKNMFCFWSKSPVSQFIWENILQMYVADLCITITVSCVICHRIFYQ